MILERRQSSTRSAFWLTQEWKSRSGMGFPLGTVFVKQRGEGGNAKVYTFATPSGAMGEILLREEDQRSLYDAFGFNVE